MMRNTALGALPQAPQSHENDNGIDVDKWLARGEDHNADDPEAMARAEASGPVKQAARPRSRSGSAAGSGGQPLSSMRASDVVPKRVEWLWSGRLAKGKHTLVAGEPSAGKSQVAASVVGLITTGGEWPCGEGTAPIGNVVILAAEDGVEDTWVPRLMALGADLSRVHFVSAGRSPTERRLIDLKKDLEALEAKVAEIGNVVLIVIDPVTAYIGDTDSRSNPKVRAVLDPLNEMAERLGTAIASITHFRKQGPGEVGGIAMHRFIDSIAFVAIARVCLAVVADAKKPERRLLVPAKGNLSAPPQGLAFTFEEVEVAEGITTTRIVWEPDPVDMSADEALADAARQGQLSSTKRAILEVLLEEGKGMKPADVADATALKPNVVRQRLYQMAKTGEVRKHGRDYLHPDCVAHDPKRAPPAGGSSTL